MSIHKQSTRLLISVAVFFILLFVVVQHVEDIEPPLIVIILLKPAEWLIRLIHYFFPRPCDNPSTVDFNMCEGTPADIFVFYFFVPFYLLPYPVITYLILSLVSKLTKRKQYL